MKSKASYVEVTYTPRGSSSNMAVVTIIDNKVMVAVTGDMAIRDEIEVKYHNVKVPAWASDDRNSVYADIVVMDALSSDSTAYDGMARIRVNPPPLNAVAVTLTEVKAETITDVKVTYSIKGTALASRIQLPLDCQKGGLPPIFPTTNRGVLRVLAISLNQQSLPLTGTAPRMW